MRLFIGLWLDDDATDELTGWARDAHALCGGRIMRRQDMHLTVAFLGRVDPDRAGTLIQAVGNWPVSMRPFWLASFGMFPRARVVWAGPAENDPISWLYILYDTLWDRLGAMGWHPPERVFRPHVSLLRGAGPCDIGKLQRRTVLVRPQRCVLVASRPGGSASNYQVLAELPVV